ncbi:hypothetical protein P872_15500 [Rhodonellum psychrophilum GCM71 = DSM 17998]|uniref:TonB-dependent receptor n=2 Tax=Rhodonellum TaxID=336827 RepID=U5C7J7_9BACT|nr:MULTISPECIES: TonB-dependent receptor [Rhodonellum]ERM84187.1 hypothetical protein P872_15500 [Rhodonellum psychrophilum GCM71 = DSM 17998]SDZ19348.1 Outer membrane receptor proteins, mostly Fe transport [Rhodonellum ikkaensis]
MKFHFAAFLIFLFGIGFSSAAQNHGGISGSIKDKNGDSVAGATIAIAQSKKGTISDAKGHFSIQNIAPGSHEISIRYIGFQTQAISFTAVPGRSITIEVILEESIYSLEGTTVTAQRREQSILNVPIAVSSTEGKFFDDLNIRDLDAFAEFVPGLQVQVQSPNNPGFVIRGITSDNGDSRVEPRVSVFQDGVSISKSRGSVVELFDMERVEVLKGPQGTLFGRGAQIGAVHFIQNKPTNDFGGKITAGYGNFNQNLISGYLNFPVSEKAFFRASGQYNKRDGYVENLAGGTLNGKNTTALRGAFRYLPSGKTTIDIITNWQKDDYPGTGFVSGSLISPNENISPFGPAHLEKGRDLFSLRTVWGSTVLIEHSLGNGWSLNSTSAFREFSNQESLDADGSDIPALSFGENAYGRQFSQEIRFSTDASQKLTGFLGGSFFHEKGNQMLNFQTNENAMIALLSPLVRVASGGQFPTIPLYGPDGKPFLGANEMLSTNLAALGLPPFKSFHEENFQNYGQVNAFEIFGDGTYQITDKLSLTAGLRGTFESVKNGYAGRYLGSPSTVGLLLDGAFGSAPNLLIAPTDGRIVGEGEFLSWVGRFIAGYKINAFSNGYLSVSRGRRPNVIQVTAEGSEELEQEIVVSYEMGYKLMSDNQRLQFDIAGFRYHYSNFQTQVIEIQDGTLRALVRDGGNASALGLETSVKFALTEKIGLFSNYGWIDAAFDEKDSEGRPQILAGNRFRLTPKHSFSFGGAVEIPIWKNHHFFFRPSYTYKSQVFFEEENQPGIEQKAFGLLNCRLGLNLENGKYEIALYGNNLLGEQYLIDAGNTGLAFGFPTFISGPPRFLGGQFTVRF